jgi:hypothetical protein
MRDLTTASNRAATGCDGFAILKRQFVDPVNWVIGDSGDDVGELAFRIDAVKTYGSINVEEDVVPCALCFHWNSGCVVPQVISTSFAFRGVTG